MQQDNPSSVSPRIITTIMIATKNRAADLRWALENLRPCHNETVEMLVADDGSDSSMEPLVKEIWPEARVIRHEVSAGQCQRRSELFLASRGDFILQLDDDAIFRDPADLQRAIALLSANPQWGALHFHIFNGPNYPETPIEPVPARFTNSFVGCAVLFRKAAVLQTGGYEPDFGNEWEEEELGLRLLKAGWALYFEPSIKIHHRVSPANRRTDRTWMRGLRNKLWSQAMHFPLLRLPIEMGWTIALGAFDAIRLFRFRRFLEGLFGFVAGLPRMLRKRQPISTVGMQRYDAMRFGEILTFAEWLTPRSTSLGEILAWFTGTWWNRPRQRSVWDKRAGDIGASKYVKYQHETLDGK